MPTPRRLQTYVVVDPGYPALSRRDYRALGTVSAPDRAAAQALVALWADVAGAARGVWLMTARAAGPGLLAAALAADGRRPV